jgi:hypothetical protein
MPLHTLMAINCQRISRHKIYFARSFLWLAVPSASAMDFNGSGGAEGQRGRSSPPASRINAVKYRAVGQEDEIADALIEECRKLEAKLLVMGSYATRVCMNCCRQHDRSGPASFAVPLAYRTLEYGCAGCRFL